MASIPNLLSLRGSARRGPPGRGPPNSSREASLDADVQGTDNDAAVSRLSAVQAGYLDDVFAEVFVRQPARRLPIINRGTYVRTTALDRLLTRFLAHDPEHPRQVVSLGAGTDTRCMRMLLTGLMRNVVYHEIDFPDVCARKMTTIQHTKTLRDLLPVEPTEGGSWTATVGDGGRYMCHGLDLRSLVGDIVIPGLVDAPTLLISECCLCYLPTQGADGVVSYFAQKLPRLGVVLYEPIRAHDAFGRVMVANLAARRIKMPTLGVYHEPADQVARLKRLGFGVGDENGAECKSVADLWDDWVDDVEKARVDALEGLDEVEEWVLLAGHYAVAWAWRGLSGWSEV